MVYDDGVGGELCIFERTCYWSALGDIFGSFVGFVIMCWSRKGVRGR